MLPKHACGLTRPRTVQHMANMTRPRAADHRRRSRNTQTLAAIN